MNIINFPGGKGSRGNPDRVERAVELKQRIVAFVQRGAMRPAFDHARRREGVGTSDKLQLIDFTDWFIYEWHGEDGITVLDEFAVAQTDLTDEDRTMLEGWSGATEGTYEILERDDRGFLLRDDDGETYYAIPTSLPVASLPWYPGMFLETRIVPVGDVYVLSGVQTTYDSRDEMEEDLAEIDDDFDLTADGPDIETALCDAFVACFGSSEVVVPPRELNATLAKFRDYAMKQFVPEGYDKPFGQVLADLGAPELPPLTVPDSLVEQLGERQVGVLADVEGGLAFVPGYGDLTQYLRLGQGDAREMRALVLALLESDAIPRFVFYHLADMANQAFGELLAEALDDPDFDIDENLDELLDELKGEEGEEDGEDDEEVVTPDDLSDVRAVDSAPADSLLEAARTFLASVEGTVKPETYEEYVTAVNLFVHYAVERGTVMTRQIDASEMLDFLAVWYPRTWSECGAADAKRTITVMGKFTAWLDRERGARVGKQFKADVQPALKEDLPRVAKAIEAIEDDVAADAFADFGAALLGNDPDNFGAALGSILDPSGGEDARRGLFTIVTIDGEDAIVRERESDVERSAPGSGEEPVRRIGVSAKAVKHLRPGDSIEAVVTPDDGKRWRIWRLVSVYPPAATL